MGVYGCETAPVNENSMRSFRTAVANTLAFTTTRTSLDRTSAIASGSKDMDPDIEVFLRRVLAYKRAKVIDAKTGKMMEDIMKIYRARFEPGCAGSIPESERILAGEPFSEVRMAMRRGCNPQGAVGLMLESMYLQAAGVDSDDNVVLCDQPHFGIRSIPHQDLASTIREA